MKAIMGVINVTPDSFSDGGRFTDPKEAARQALALVEAGASVLDIGAESTRLNFVPVPVDEEIRRLVPAIEAIRDVTDVSISVDTVKPEAARAALDAGADVINDMNGILAPGMAELAAETGCGLIIAHSGGSYPDLHRPVEGDAVVVVRDFLEERLAHALDAGVKKDRIILDPGVGFGKTMDDNVRLMDSASEFSFGCPVLIGVSRKRVLAHLYPGIDPEEATVLASLRALNAGADMVRVHGTEAIMEIHLKMAP